MTLAKEGEYTAIRDCYYSDGVYKHKFYKVGEFLLSGWIPDANGCTHFARTVDAKKIIRAGTAEQKALTSGDDNRSTEEIRNLLTEFMKVPMSWTRKKMWGELVKRETAVAKDAQTNPKEKK